MFLIVFHQLNFMFPWLFNFFKFLSGPHNPQKSLAGGCVPCTSSYQPTTTTWWWFSDFLSGPQATRLVPFNSPPWWASNIDQIFDLNPCGPHLNLAKLSVPFSVQKQEIQVLILKLIAYFVVFFYFFWLNHVHIAYLYQF